MQISNRNKHIRPVTPKFDFLKTVSLPTSPQPCMVKEKRMFLSLYKSIKMKEVKKNNEKHWVSYSQPPKRQIPLAIEGLVPVPTWKRVERRRILSAKRKGNAREIEFKLIKTTDGDQNGPIQVRVHSRNLTPVFIKPDLASKY